jgi:hypothetical protein
MSSGEPSDDQKLLASSRFGFHLFQIHFSITQSSSASRSQHIPISSSVPSQPFPPPFIMKLSNSIIFFVFALFFPVVTEANFIVQILFNNGNPDACSDNEWNQIDYAIFVVSQHQRNRGLRGENSTALADGPDVDTGIIDRELQYYPNYCANNCAGFAPRKCRAVNCVGYRRRGMVETMTRSLFWATDCNNQISELNNLINNMRNVNGFSAGCKSFLGQSRTYNCFTNESC